MKVMETRRLGKVQNIAFRTHYSSQNQDYNPRDGLDGFIQHMGTVWKDNKEIPDLSRVPGRERREN
jgi:hypothetical protein